MTENTAVGIALDNEALRKLHKTIEQDTYLTSKETKLVLDLIAQARAAQPQPSAAPSDEEIYEHYKALELPHAPVMWEAARRTVRAVLAAAPSPNFAARGAEPAGMQAAGQSIDTPEFRQRFSYMLRGECADLVAHIDAQLSATRQGHVDAVSTSGERVEKSPGNEHVEETPQPTAAPTPQAQPAGAQEDERSLFEAAEIAYWQSRQPAHADPLTAEEKAYLLRPNVWDKTSYEACDGRWEGWQWRAQLDHKGAAAPTPHEQEARAAVPDLLPPMGIRNDRDMLDYLARAFANETSVCERCGHDEPTSTMDSASFLRDYLEARSAQPSAQAGMLPVAQTDAARLDFMIQYGAHVAHTMDGETCNVWLPAECDGTEERPAEGWPQKRYSDGRSAIDAAMRALGTKGAAGLEGGAGGAS